MIAGFFSRLLLGLAKFIGFYKWGQERERRKNAENTLKRGEMARDAAREARNENANLDDNAIRDRVRDRADRWK